jgi:hypothetical protein
MFLLSYPLLPNGCLFSIHSFPPFFLFHIPYIRTPLIPTGALSLLVVVVVVVVLMMAYVSK